MMAKHVSRPMKSAKVKGPIGMLVPSFIVVSMSSLDAIPYPNKKTLVVSQRMPQLKGNSTSMIQSDIRPHTVS